MRLLISVAILSVVLAGSFFGIKSSDSMEKAVQHRHAAIERSIDGVPESLSR